MAKAAKPKPAAPAQPEREAQFGLWWPKHVPEFNRRMVAARWGSGTVSQFEHRKWCIEKLWPPDPDVYEMNDWSDRRLRATCENVFAIFMGPGGCVRGDTLIPDPVTGESKPIRDLFLEGNPITVMTLDGPARASAPFIMGRERLYQIVLETGEQVACSGSHRFLTPSGYRFAADLCDGDFLLGYDACHLRSTSEHDPSTHGLDAPDSQKTTANSQANCSAYLHPDGARPHWEEEIARSFFPSLDGAQEHSSYVFSDEDARDNESHDTHLCLYAHRLSTSDSSDPDLRTMNSVLRREQEEISSHAFWMSQHDGQSQIESGHRDPLRALIPYSENTVQSCKMEGDACCVRLSYSGTLSPKRVASITRTHLKELFYDIQVPGPNHYFAEGMIHHNCGKTTDSAALAIEYWLEDPGNTAVIVCSTTKDMLRKRIWGEICRLWHLLPKDIDYKGVLTDTNCMIRWRDNDMKNGIFGIAVADGPVEDAINNLVGIHTKRVFLILDEMQGVNEAIMGALPNMVKNPESKFLGMGNPTSMQSMLCKFITPIGGWHSIVECETADWEIDGQPYIGKARGYFFDGRKSPAYLNPEWAKKRPWMISRSQVDNHIRQKGENSPEVRTMTIGWPPSVGTDNTVLDISIIEKFHCREPAHWTDGFTEMAALDPSFTEAGDNKILQFFRVGLVNDLQGHRWVIEFREWFEVPLDTKRKDDPPEYQILRFCREKCESKGITSSQFGTDATGTGMGLASIFRKEWGPIVGVEFGGAASDLIVEDNGKTGREVFDRRSSELNIMVRNFANANGIRGLTQPAEKEFCARLTTTKLKHIVETKKDVKKRLGYSPGNSDACCIAVDMARQMGAFPGRSGPAIEVREQDVARQQYESDQRFSESTQEDDWSEFAMTML